MDFRADTKSQHLDFYDDTNNICMKSYMADSKRQFFKSQINKKLSWNQLLLILFTLLLIVIGTIFQTYNQVRKFYIFYDKPKTVPLRINNGNGNDSLNQFFFFLSNTKAAINAS